MVSKYPLSDERREAIAEQLERYIATDGADGYFVNGNEHLVLTTIGRRTGEPRSTPLIFGADGDRYLIVASLGDMTSHPTGI